VCACVQGAGDRRDVRSRRDELTTAARNEAHKLQRVQEARAALHALPDTGAFVCVSVCVCVSACVWGENSDEGMRVFACACGCGSCL
jgi:hypothetical protein